MSEDNIEYESHISEYVLRCLIEEKRKLDKLREEYREDELW